VRNDASVEFTEEVNVVEMVGVGVVDPSKLSNELVPDSIVLGETIEAETSSGMMIGMAVL